MAFEQKDLDALKQWGEQRAAIEQRKAEETLCPEPVKKSFWVALFAGLFSEKSSFYENIADLKTGLERNDLAGGESEMTVSYHERNSSNYSPLVGGEDW